jgi:hypothetical protein
MLYLTEWRRCNISSCIPLFRFLSISVLLAARQSKNAANAINSNKALDRVWNSSHMLYFPSMANANTPGSQFSPSSFKMKLKRMHHQFDGAIEGRTLLNPALVCYRSYFPFLASFCISRILLSRGSHGAL